MRGKQRAHRRGLVGHHLLAACTLRLDLRSLQPTIYRIQPLFRFPLPRY
eukprot:COSAG01_NODE_1301_length_10829_cov_20.185182_15_plen_48_part_01